MAQFEFENLNIKDAVLVKTEKYSDFRGDFIKLYEKNLFEQRGIDFKFSENCFIHSKKNVWRGLHFQDPKPQARLLTVSAGSIYNVMVDLRDDSETYLKWQGITMKKGQNCLYVPKGVANGFLAIEDSMILCQNCGEYDSKCEKGIRYDDVLLGIQFPIPYSKIICSEKDKNLMSLQKYLEQNKVNR